jgi:hypothetical protein
MRSSRSTKLADDGSESLDSHLPIISGLLETVQETLHISIPLVVPVNQLQLTDNTLSFLEDLTDPLVISLHAGLDLDKVNILTHNELASIELILGSSREDIDGVFEVWELGLDVLAHVGQNDP